MQNIILHPICYIGITSQDVVGCDSRANENFPLLSDSNNQPIIDKVLWPNGIGN